jgi:EmrB/QacA subfamily drug resistance transporter
MAGLLLTMLLTSLDQTIVSTAMPTVVEKLGGMELYAWVFTIYMLTSTVLMPIVGKLSDMYGRKKFYMLGLAIFMLGSALCGAAESMTQLIVFRGIQGIGAGTLVPIIFTLIFGIMPQDKAARYQSLFMAVFGLSSVVGPSLGSFITEHFSWRWNFYINLPLGILVFFVLSWSLVEPKASVPTKKSIDYLGAALLAIATVSVMLALKLAGVDYAWGSWQVVGLFAVFAIATVSFLLVERRAVEPMLPLSIFRNRTIAGTTAVTFVQGVVMFGSLTYIPMFIQGVIGGDVGDSGHLLTPMMFSVMVGATIGGFTMAKLTWRTNMLLSMLIAGTGCFFMTQAPVTASKWNLVVYMVLIGLGIGIMMPISQTAISVTADPKYQGVATSIVGFFRTIGGVFGTSIMAAIVNTVLSNQITAKTAQFHLPPDRAAALTDPQVLLRAESQIPAGILSVLRQALADALHQGFWFAVGAALVALIVSVFMGRERFNPEEWKERKKAQQGNVASV